MDPVSVTASLLTVIHAAGVCLGGVRKLNSYRKVPDELDRFRIELESLKILLENVKVFVTQSPSVQYCELLHAPVKRASELMVSVDKTLSSPVFGVSKLSEENKARLTWFRYRQRLATLAEDMKSTKTDLGLRLGLLTASSTGRLEGLGNSLNQTLILQRQLSQQVSSVLDRMALADFEAAQQSIPPAQAPQSEETPIGQSHLRDRVEEDQGTLMELPRSKLASPGLSTATKRRHCPGWCACACHSRRHLKTPWALNALLGELSIRYNGRAQVQCNCLGPSSLAVTYSFPQYLLRRYVSFAVQCSSSSPELLLRIPRIMPWDHKLWRYLMDGNVAAVQRMYTLGLASPHDISMHASNSLYYAASGENVEMIHFLLDQGVDCNHATFIGYVPGEMLWDRAFGGHYGADGSAIVRKVLPGNDGIDDMGFSTLHKIILGIMYKDIRTVLEATLDFIDATDSRGRTPMHWAALCDDAEAVNTLLAFGADPNVKDSSGHLPIDHVRSAGVCKSLLKAGSRWGSNPLKKDRGVLHNVVRTGTPGEVVDILVNAGVDVNAVNDDRETPLVNAIYWNRTEMAHHLVAVGADIDLANVSSQEGPIHFAGNFDRPEILPLLLGRGADYTASNIYGRDLGHCAALFAGVEFIDAMAKSNLKKLNLDKRDRDGKTAKDYMNGRIIMTDREIGVHEAFEALAASLSPYSRLTMPREDSLDELEAQNLKNTEKQPPGAFPSEW